jgi:alkyl sulfatase BDS1-like metallo-beta-lactamase superfamily hydrolase
MSTPVTREPLYRQRPGADAIMPATDAPAVDLGDGFWMSSGLSNSYMLRTRAGRVIVNCGMGFESPYHRAAFDAVDDSPIHTIILTQGHPDHFGGVDQFRDSGTQIVTHANFRIFRDDFEKLQAFRVRNSAFAWMEKLQTAFDHARETGRALPGQSSPEPTLTFTEQLDLETGGRRLQLISTPGGETTDSLVIWLPDCRTMLTGNVLGPLFGHVPNLVTVRGDRYRDALAYVDSIDRIRAFRPVRLVTGHFNPIEGEEVIEDELRRMRDATKWVHDRTVEGMNAGKDVHTLMREITLPADLDVGEGYGKVAWNVRAIWETYAGWFHHRSTTELYATPPAAIAPDIVNAVGADALTAAAEARLTAGQPVEALHLLDVVLSAEPGNSAAKRVAVNAHTVLLSRSANFWEAAWLKRRIAELTGENP